MMPSEKVVFEGEVADIKTELSPDRFSQIVSLEDLVKKRNTMGSRMYVSMFTDVGKPNIVAEVFGYNALGGKFRVTIERL